MENASKALLIAGAILIAILIIGVGMMVMQGGEGITGTALLEMSAQEKDMFNDKFTRYAGERVQGTSVRALLQNVISSNTTNKDIAGKLVSISGIETINAKEGSAMADEISVLRTKINTGATYKVTLKYNADTGLVETVDIVKN